MDWGALIGGQVAPWGIVAFVVYAVLTDRLVTKARLVQALAERDAWEKAYRDEKDTTTAMLAREHQNTTVAETVKHLLDTLPVPRGEPQANEPHPPPSAH